VSHAGPAVVLPPPELLACPRCEGTLQRVDEALACERCHSTYPFVDGTVDFTAQITDEEWSHRQRAMLEWYEELAADAETTEDCFRADYGVIASRLSELSGTVLDVGGGAGVTRRYLAPAVRYVNVEPSMDWLGTRWAEHASPASPLSPPMAFVKATGEALPFRSATFDAVLSLWSLNHAKAPQRVIEECARVLKPGGTALLVLEDMNPRWRDLSSMSPRVAAWTLRRKAAAGLRIREWPVQFDHVSIDEDALRQWCSGRFAVSDRQWADAGRPAYLVLALRRI
jgi:SAM-dependent methyltransferase